MKQSESNPLQRELARGQHDAPHPDANVLTALGEGALLQAERQQVLNHVAGCRECREVMSISAAAALDSADDIEPFVLTHTPNQPQRTWLPWASVAAGLLIVCSAVLVYQQRTLLTKNTEAANKEPAQLPLSPLQPTPPSVESKKTPSKAVNTPATKQLQVPVGSQNPIAGDETTADKIELTKKSELTQRNSYKRSADVSAMETSSAPVLKAAQAPPAAAFANTITERAMSAASVSAARPHWRINSMGQAERAYGVGAWQPVLPLEQSKMRVISVLDSEIWIGGENSRLYRSTDNGATWKQVSLPEKDGPEHSIAHIHFQTVLAGTVESDDGTVWTTSDGGSTWE